VRARQCAYLECTSRADTGGFSGNTMLMIIYANGVGAEHLDLATTLACPLDGAPAEEDCRVKRLDTLKAIAIRLQNR